MSWFKFIYQTSPRESQFFFLCQREAREWVQQHACAIQSQAARWAGCTFIPLNMAFPEMTVVSLASVAVGDKVMKDIRPGVPFEPTYIYKLLTLIKSSLSEKVSSLITVLMGFNGLIRCLDIFENVCVRDPSSVFLESVSKAAECMNIYLSKWLQPKKLPKPVISGTSRLEHPVLGIFFSWAAFMFHAPEYSGLHIDWLSQLQWDQPTGMLIFHI